MPMSEHHDQGSEGTSRLPCSPRTLRFLGVAAAAVALAVAAGGVFSRNEHAEAGAKWTDAAAPPTVSTLPPTPDKAGHTTPLPPRRRGGGFAPASPRGCAVAHA